MSAKAFACLLRAQVLAVVAVAFLVLLSVPVADAAKKKTSYNGKWTLVSLNGQKVKPYWEAQIRGSKFTLYTSVPRRRCKTVAKMAVDGRYVTFTTTSTSCKGEKKGDVDRGLISLFGATLTFVSKTNGQKWVFVKNLAQVKKTAAKRKRESSPEAPSDFRRYKAPTAPKKSKNPVVVAERKSPKIIRISPLTLKEKIPAGHMSVTWIKRSAALNYYFNIEGTLKRGGLFQKANEVYNSTCDPNVCRQNLRLEAGYYTVRIDSEYRVVGPKVKLEVGAKPKRKRSKIRPATAPDGLIGPVGPIAENEVSVFRWNQAKGGVTYELHVQKVGKSSDDAIIHMGDKGLLCNGDGPCSVTLSEPLGPGNYIWWVEANVLSYGKGRSFSVYSIKAPRGKRN
ncbi:MAG: hypothetical protein OEZ04_02365 [Nitrospinota bacterium]|nr:hypothetical protein [Nitrospinota bacterium]